MKFATVSKAFYCGVDLHSKTMTIAIIDRNGKRITRRTINNDFSEFVKIIEPYKNDIAVALESTFNWYWFCDACKQNNIEVYMGHSLYMKSIYCDKFKNDYIDAEKISNLLRSNMLPVAYIYPKDKRVTRDLLRKRMNLVAMRSSLLANSRTLCYQYGFCDVSSRDVKNVKLRDTIPLRFEHSHTKAAANANINIAKSLDKEVKDIEKELHEYTENNYNEQMKLLLSVPGIGNIIACTILYEIDTIDRFKTRNDFSSYCRLVRSTHTSNGKWAGYSNSKIGNPYLKNAFIEIVTNAQKDTIIHEYYTKLKNDHKPMKARAILASKICTIVYFMLKNKTKFDIDKFKKAKTEDSCQPDTEDGNL